MSLKTPLPANLPENWTYGQIVAPTGQEVGLPEVYGYNYLMNQVNNAQKACIELDEQKGQPDGVAPLDKDKVLALQYGGLGAKTAQEAIYKLGCMPRENLLDNAHFVGGGTDGNFPINPKGIKQYNTVGSCIPRWKLQNANSSLEIVDDGIILRDNATEHDGASISFLQIVSKNVNQETVTYAIIASELSGDWYMAYNNVRDGNKKIEVGLTFITIPSEHVVLDGKSFYLFKTSKNANDYIKFQDLKLEKGDTQTLGWKDTNGNIHLFDTPDYVTQFLKYQYYFERVGNSTSAALTNTVYVPKGAKAVTFIIPFTYKRIIPTISFSEPSQYRLLIQSVNETNLATSVGIKSFGLADVTKTAARVTITTNGDVPFDGYMVLQRADNSTAAWIDVSAEL